MKTGDYTFNLHDFTLVSKFGHFPTPSDCLKINLTFTAFVRFYEKVASAPRIELSKFVMINIKIDKILPAKFDSTRNATYIIFLIAVSE